MALMLFAMGVSPEGITLVLDQQMTLKVHRASVQRWADRYVRLVERYAGRLRPSTGGVWSCDEKFARVRGADHWVFTVMDTASRFILSWDVSPRKLTYDAVSLFGRARDRAGCIPRIFKTDGLHPFRPAFRKAFWRRRGPRPFHFRESHIRNRRCTNNGQQRFNGTLGEFLDGTRGLQRTDSTLVRRQPAALQFHSATPRAGRDHARRGRGDQRPRYQHLADPDPARGAGRHLGGNQPRRTFGRNKSAVRSADTPQSAAIRTKSGHPGQRRGP